jgi:hypothetical protein
MIKFEFKHTNQEFDNSLPSTPVTNDRADGTGSTTSLPEPASSQLSHALVDRFAIS